MAINALMFNLMVPKDYCVRHRTSTLFDNGVIDSAFFLVDSNRPAPLPITHDKSYRFNDRATQPYHFRQGTDRETARPD
jgi:hypothetical protein